MNELTVGNVTPEQWAEFWKSRGWIECQHKGQYDRDVKRADAITIYRIYTHFPVAICWVNGQEGHLCNWSRDTPLATIEDELNELAATKIMGGWA